MAYQRPQPVLPRWLRLWFPPLLVLIIIPAKLVSPSFYHDWINGEQGLIELATPLVALIGALFGALLVKRLLPSRDWLVIGWAATVTLACVYFAGEELSWGQQLLHWSTPEVIDQLNDQHETNLHNMSSWFDQKPRALLELWVVIGGIWIPVREWLRGSRCAQGGWWFWFWPTMDCLPTAVMAELIRAPQRYKQLAGIKQLPFEIRWSEPQEYYFALFLALYLISLYVRIVARDKAALSVGL
jgi:hypothetical protein